MTDLQSLRHNQPGVHPDNENNFCISQLGPLLLKADYESHRFRRGFTL